MPEGYRGFGSYILFSPIFEDELGHIYRAGEIKGSTVKRTVWLRVFDGSSVPAASILEQREVADRIGELLKASNAAADPIVGDVGGTPTLAFDYVPGQPLERIFVKVRDEGFPVPVDNALLILEKIALALTAALAIDIEHKSLVHGFLHPGFVVVSNEGEAVVSGFGIGDAVLDILDDPSARERVAPYLAPEILVARTAGKRGDVYSLGAILFQLLTGEALPADPAARQSAIAGATLAFDDEAVPADIMGLLKRSLADRPEERFSSAADFKKELDKLLYGGNYSPTTFNLALFMDRLFRSEIEAEEKSRPAEQAVDVAAFLAPEPEPEPIEEADDVEPRPKKSSAGLWAAVAVVVVAAGVGGYFLVGRGGGGSAATPTPTAEQVEAERLERQRMMEQMVQEEVAARLEAKEAEIREQLTSSQDEINRLQSQLKDMERPSSSSSGGGQMSAEAQRQAEELKRKLAQAEEEKRKREAALEEARKKAREEAEQKVEEQLAKATPTPAPAVAPTAAPTATPAPRPTATPVRIARNTFVDPTQVDQPPQQLRQTNPAWSRAAQRSRRQGVVIMRAKVDADGRVEEVEVLRADEEAFGIPQAAMDAVRKYTFEPATKNGVAVKTWATVTIPFSFR